MADVFISYSRDDSTIGREIHTALRATGRDLWMDWTSVPLTAEWWNEITDGIELAEQFLFLVSPSSVASPICNLELEYARSLNKRIVPVVVRKTDEKSAHVELVHKPLTDYQQVLIAGRDLLLIARDNWKALAPLNWVNFADDESFATNLTQLVRALETDVEHVKAHTRWLIRAQDWERRGALPSALLGGAALTEAEDWLKGSGKKEPLPLDLHHRYISASRTAEDEHERLKGEEIAWTKALEEAGRKAEAERAATAAENERLARRTRRFRWTAAIAALIGAVAIGATVVAVGQTGEARRAEADANTRVAIASTSERDAQNARSTSEAEEDIARAAEATAEAAAAVALAAAATAQGAERIALAAQQTAEVEQATAIAQQRAARLAEAESQVALGNLSYFQGDGVDIGPAREALENAIQTYRDLGAIEQEANASVDLGNLFLYRNSDHHMARVSYQTALALFRLTENRTGEANVLLSLGDLALQEDDLRGAHEAYEAALTIYQTVEDQLGEANTLRSMGDLAVREDNLAEAREAYEAALILYQTVENGSENGEANTLLSLGDLASQENNLTEANRAYEAALPLFRAIGDQRGEANTLRGIGALALREDDLAGAREAYRAALTLFRVVGSQLGEANTLLGLGDLALRENNLGEARESYEGALSIYQSISLQLGEANTLLGLGDLALQENSLVEARESYKAALLIYQSFTDRLGEANTLFGLGNVAVNTDDLELADDYFGRAEVLYRQIGNFVGLLNTLLGRTRIAIAQDSIEVACGHFQMIFDLVEGTDFENHPITNRLRFDAGALGCEGSPIFIPIS